MMTRGAGGVVGAKATRTDDVRCARLHGSMASVALSEAEKVYIVHGVQVATAAAASAGFPWPYGLLPILGSPGRMRPGRCESGLTL
jgi:hypothetical protein